MTTAPLHHAAVPPRLILHTLIRRTRGHAIAWPVGKADGRAAPGDGTGGPVMDREDRAEISEDRENLGNVA